MENSYTIDLEKHRTPGARVFTGRDRGEDVRKKSKIDQIEPKYSKIKIIIPPDLYSVNPSFLEEFLNNVVLKLKKDQFYEKFSFINNGDYKIENDLRYAVERILRKNNALL